MNDRRPVLTPTNAVARLNNQLINNGPLRHTKNINITSGITPLKKNRTDYARPLRHTKNTNVTPGSTPTKKDPTDYAGPPRPEGKNININSVIAGKRNFGTRMFFANVPVNTVNNTCVIHNIGNSPAVSETLNRLPIASLDFNSRPIDLLIDSGSCISIIKHSELLLSETGGKCHHEYELLAVNGSPIKGYGCMDATIRIGDKEYRHHFFIADTDFNLLGYDFMCSNKCSFECKDKHFSFSAQGPSYDLLHTPSVNNMHEATHTIHAVGSTAPKAEVVPEVWSTTITEGRFAALDDESAEYPEDDIIVEDCIICTGPQMEWRVKPERPVARQRTTVNAVSNGTPSSYTQEEQIQGDTPEALKANSLLKKHLDSIRPAETKRLADKHPQVFTDKIDFTKPTDHGVEMELNLDGVYKKPHQYRVPYAYRDKVHERVKEMIADGLLRPSASDYSAPTVAVPKKDGRIRVCADFRALNAVTIPDNYAMPRIDDIKLRVAGKIFSTLDLREGFNQVPIKESDIRKTAMHTPWGAFEYTRMPFGLRNAPAVFQRFLNLVVHGLEHTEVYIDDIIVYTQTLAEHKLALNALFHLDRSTRRSVQEAEDTLSE